MSFDLKIVDCLDESRYVIGDTIERYFTKEHEVEYETAAPNINFLVIRLALEHLGRTILWCSCLCEELAGLVCIELSRHVEIYKI
jgi:hypothetical protein